MGYVIGCYAPKNNGKSTTIKALCAELESIVSSQFETLYSDGNPTTGKKDIIRAYRRYGILVYVISGGDSVAVFQSGYEELKFACGGLDCDLLICALTQNKIRQSKRINEIEKTIEKIAKSNGHWMEWYNLAKLYDSESHEQKKIRALKQKISNASEQLIRSAKLNKA